MNSKIIPALTLAALLGASGAVIASAQTAPSDDAAATATTVAPEVEAPVQPAGFFDGRGPGEGFGRGGPDREILREVLRQADADNDGAVTQSEIDALRTTLVTGADASGEGDLSLAEFENLYAQLVQSQMVDAFQGLDEDGDGTVTPAELDARLSGVVERMDQDGDAALSPVDRPEGGHGRHG